MLWRYCYDDIDTTVSLLSGNKCHYIDIVTVAYYGFHIFLQFVDCNYQGTDCKYTEYYLRNDKVDIQNV